MARTQTKPVGRTPIKRRACESWLGKQLADRPWPARNVLEVAAKLGWGWATVRRAKGNVGARSFKKGHEWWWFDPNTYTPAVAPAGAVAKNSTAEILEKVTDKTDAVEVAERSVAVEPWKLPQAVATGADQRQDFAGPKPATYHIRHPDQAIENKRAGLAPPVPPQTREPVAPKPIEPLKPRRIRIWENEIQETRHALISAAGFADLYVMRADIWLRQEQLRSRGLLQDELALNGLLARINEALEKKKRDANIEANQ